MMASSNVARSGMVIAMSWMRLSDVMTAWDEKGSEVGILAMTDDEICKDAWIVPYIMSYITRESFE